MSSETAAMESKMISSEKVLPYIDDAEETNDCSSSSRKEEHKMEEKQGTITLHDLHLRRFIVYIV
jgi:hypothetical protein